MIFDVVERRDWNDRNRLVCQRNQEVLWIEPWGRDTIRVRKSPGRVSEEAETALLEPDRREASGASPAIIDISGDKAVVRSGDLQAVVDSNGLIRFDRPVRPARGAAGAAREELLAEYPGEMFDYMRYRDNQFVPAGGDLYRITCRFARQPGERVYGLGQRTHGRLEQTGCVMNLEQENTEVNIPFLLSSRGYGFLWNNPGTGVVVPAVNETRWVAHASRQIDYAVMTGPTFFSIMERYAEATGKPPAFPEWAAGFWQSKNRYTSQDEVLEIAREYKKRGVPLSVIVIDYFYWTSMGSFDWQPEAWPDPGAMVDELARMGIKVVISVWPGISAKSRNFDEMMKNGLLVTKDRSVAPVPLVLFPDGKDLEKTGIFFYDPTNPAARAAFWSKVRKGYYDMGIHAFWLDADEPDQTGIFADAIRFHAGLGSEMANLYPLKHVQTYYEGMKAAGQEEILNLSRGAWAGSQRYGAAVWSGDIPSTFESLQQSVRAGLNIAMSGIPWWTTDIGGYHSGDPRTPYMRELIIRWFQFGLFCPLFRLHGVRLPRPGFSGVSGAPNEIWCYGEEAYKTIVEIIRMRYRLIPYLMEQMKKATAHGTPLMRPLFFDFQDDETCYTIDDQYMFGPDILVAPVLSQGQTTRRLYLPAGAAWKDAWSAEMRPGGAWVTVEAPLDRIPVHLRNGADLPVRA
jgi:alpha-D-xyloside xylohydrolase